MTLPTDIFLPLQTELVSKAALQDPAQIALYNKNLIESLTDMYQEIAQNVNGGIRNWTPIAYGTGTAGTGTYTNQNGWLRRAGLMTELWIDIGWSAHTGTGGLAIQMPYKAAKSEGQPWVGVIQSVSASNDFGAGYTYLVWKCEQDTIQGTIVRCGSLVASDEQQIANVGRYVGYIQYLGQAIEN